VEDFEVWRRAKGGEKWGDLPESSGIVEFFDSVDESPELCESIEVTMVDVNLKQPIACVRQDHVEEWGSRLLEVNGGP
jgi:hypothetical protein